jgi:hypothetical protein
MSKQSKLGPNTMVYFVLPRVGADGVPTLTPESPPITLREAAEKLRQDPIALIMPVEGDSAVLSPEQIEEALKPGSGLS